MNITKGKEILKKYRDRGQKAYLVGECVVNLLLDRDSSEISLVVDEYIKDIDNEDIRLCIIYEGGLDNYLSSQWFTLDTICYDGETFIDNYGGQDDLKNHRIKCIGDNRQDKVFNEPYVIFEAIVYAFRLTQIPDQYNNYTGVTFSLDTEFMDFIVNNVDRISMLGDKRVGIVLKDIAMLGGNKLSNFINMMKTYGLLQYILPEIDRLYYFRHNFEEHPEGAEASGANRVLSHTTAALQEYNGDDYNVLLAILYNDIGKAKTYSFKYDVNNESEPTRHIYTNKDIAGLKLLNEMGIENYYSKETAEIIKFCMENSEKWWNIEAMDKAEALEIVGHKYYDILEEVVRCKDAAKQCDSNPQVKMFLMENQIQKTSNFPKVKSYIKNNLKPKKRKLL